MAKSLAHFYATTNFTFGELIIRTHSDNGQPWFILKDVAQALGYENARRASRLLDPAEKGDQKVVTLGGPQKLTTINESGLYTLIMASRKPEAKRFQKWVTREVLPALRQTGTYTKPGKSEQNQPLAHAKPAQNAIKQIANAYDGLANDMRHVAYKKFAPQVPACQDHGPIDHTKPRNLPALPDGLVWHPGIEQAIEHRTAELAMQAYPAIREYIRRHVAYTACNSHGQWAELSKQLQTLEAASLQDAFAYQESQAIQTAQAGLRAVQRVVQAALEGGRA